MATKELFPLSNQSAVSYAYSRFNRHPVYQDPETGNKFIGTWNPPKIPTSPSDRTLQISQENAYRPDVVSYQFYNTPSLAWVICYANGISNPWDKVNGLYPGLVITIPDLTTITILTF